MSDTAPAQDVTAQLPTSAQAPTPAQAPAPAPTPPPAVLEMPPAPAQAPAPAPALDVNRIQAAMAAEQMLRRQDELGQYMQRMESELQALKTAPAPAQVRTTQAQDLPDDIAADPLAQKIVGIERTVQSLAQTFASQVEEQKRAAAEQARVQARQNGERIRDRERVNALKWLNEGVIKNDPELAGHPGACEELRDFADQWMADKFDPAMDMQFQGRALQLDVAKRISALKGRFMSQQAPRQQALERNTAIVNNPAPGTSGVSQIPPTPGAPASPFKHPADSREGLKERFAAKLKELGLTV